MQKTFPPARCCSDKVLVKKPAKGTSKHYIMYSHGNRTRYDDPDLHTTTQRMADLFQATVVTYDYPEAKTEQQVYDRILGVWNEHFHSLETGTPIVLWGVQAGCIPTAWLVAHLGNPYSKVVFQSPMASMFYMRCYRGLHLIPEISDCIHGIIQCPNVMQHIKANPLAFGKVMVFDAKNDLAVTTDSVYAVYNQLDKYMPTSEEEDSVVLEVFDTDMSLVLMHGKMEEHKWFVC